MGKGSGLPIFPRLPQKQTGAPMTNNTLTCGLKSIIVLDNDGKTHLQIFTTQVYDETTDTITRDALIPLKIAHGSRLDNDKLLLELADGHKIVLEFLSQPENPGTINVYLEASVKTDG